MDRPNGNWKLSIYGDSFMMKISPLLKKKLKLDIRDQLTIKQVKIKKLYRRVRQKYSDENRKPRKKETNDLVLLMVGIYDIIQYKKIDKVQNLAKRMFKNLKAFVKFLIKYHTHIILLAPLPVLNLQGKKHWELIRRFNVKMTRLTVKSNVNIIDLCPVFMESMTPPRCNRRFYDRTSPRQMNIIWNYPGMRKALDHIKLAVLNVQKLQSSCEEIKIEKEEICSDQTIMTSKFNDVCLGDNGCQHAPINCFRDSSSTERNSGFFEPAQTSYFCTSKPDAPANSIYNSNTVHLREDMKQKLSWMRFTEYSSYGNELIESNKIKSIKNELLTVATYNVLSQDLLEKHRYLYSQHDPISLNWIFRKDILLEEFALLDADILCLQEIDSHILESFYEKYLHERGYQGVYKRRTHEKIDGCAIYFRNNKFNLVESAEVELFKESITLLDKDNIGIILKLSLKNDPSAEFIAATTHLLYNPKRTDIRLAQTQVMLAEIERLAYKGTDLETGLPVYLPIIFTGDMNYTPKSAIYQLVTESYLPYEGMTLRYRSQWSEALKKTLLPPTAGVTDFCQLASTLSTRNGLKKVLFESGTLRHWLNLASVYDHVKKDLPETTTNQEDWPIVDYIFYSRDGRLKLISKLTLPNIREAEDELRSIPNSACASDHLPLLATFHLTGS